MRCLIKCQLGIHYSITSWPTLLVVANIKRHDQYIKVNFHKDNFVIVDKVIDVLVPLSEMDHTLREKLYSLRSDTYTFLNYCYAVHIREAVEALNETVCHFLPQEHDAKQFDGYQQLNELLRHPDSLDDPATQQHIVSEVQNQLTFCAKAMGKALEQNESNGIRTHSALDLALDRRPNNGPKAMWSHGLPCMQRPLSFL